MTAACRQQVDAVVLDTVAPPRVVDEEHPLVGDREQARLAERLGAFRLRFDRCVRATIGRDTVAILCFPEPAA